MLIVLFVLASAACAGSAEAPDTTAPEERDQTEETSEKAASSDEGTRVEGISTTPTGPRPQGISTSPSGPGGD
jgi:hypothetical protein